MDFQTISIRGCKTTLVALIWLLPHVCFHMPSQIAWIRWCIDALIACVGFLSAVFLHMSPQIWCKGWCIFTLVTFVCLFSIVGFHMFTKNSFMYSCITALAAFIWLFPLVCFHMHPQGSIIGECRGTVFAPNKFFNAVGYLQMFFQFAWGRSFKLTLTTNFWHLKKYFRYCLKLINLKYACHISKTCSLDWTTCSLNIARGTMDPGYVRVYYGVSSLVERGPRPKGWL